MLFSEKIAFGYITYIIVIHAISLIILSLGFNIQIIYYRFDHYGKVCSGDFHFYTNMKGYDVNQHSFYDQAYEN